MGKGNSELRVCSARIELAIPEAFTLKDRRAVVKSLVEKLHGRFNLAASDLDGGENGANRAVIGIAAATNSAKLASETIQKAIEFISSDGRAELGNVEIGEL